jgi:hypothetical protein
MCYQDRETQQYVCKREPLCMSGRDAFAASSAPLPLHSCYHHHPLLLPRSLSNSAWSPPHPLACLHPLYTAGWHTLSRRSASPCASRRTRLCRPLPTTSTTTPATGPPLLWQRGTGASPRCGLLLLLLLLLLLYFIHVCCLLVFLVCPVPQHPTPTLASWPCASPLNAAQISSPDRKLPSRSTCITVTRLPLV